MDFICCIILGASLPTTVLFLFSFCLFVRKKPARPHCHCCRRRETNTAHNNSTQSETETTPLLGEKSIAKSPVVVTPKLSWLERSRQLLPFLGLFTPLVVFWAIFYQQSSTWVLQGRDMNCYIGRLHVPPGQ